jgi:hypothetical protein
MSALLCLLMLVPCVAPLNAFNYAGLLIWDPLGEIMVSIVPYCWPEPISIAAMEVEEDPDDNEVL